MGIDGLTCIVKKINNLNFFRKHFLQVTEVNVGDILPQTRSIIDMFS